MRRSAIRGGGGRLQTNTWERTVSPALAGAVARITPRCVRCGEPREGSTGLCGACEQGERENGAIAAAGTAGRCVDCADPALPGDVACAYHQAHDDFYADMADAVSY